MIYLYLKHLLNLSLLGFSDFKLPSHQELSSSWQNPASGEAPELPCRSLYLIRLKALHSTSSFRMSELETNVVVTKLTPWLYWGENQEAKK